MRSVGTVRRGCDVHVMLVLLALGSAGCPSSTESEPVERTSEYPHAAAAQPSGPEAALSHYRRALELERSGDRLAALHEAELAAAGGHDDGGLLAAKLAIELGDLARATRRLDELLEQNPKHARALYNRGLVAQRQGDYNTARHSYLTALAHNEGLADARFNLAVLTWKAGVHPEARHHVAKFRARWPDDPRSEELATLVGPEPDRTARAPEGAPR